MTVDVLVADVGSGKTAAAIERLSATAKHNPFAQIWVLLPGKRQEDAFRQRVLEVKDGQRVYFNITFFSFYTLYAHILEMAALPQRMLDEHARIQVVQTILRELHESNQLRVFHTIADKPGFTRVAARFIYELKQNMVGPDRFYSVASQRSGKDYDLALIYAQYQEKLRDHKLVDKEGEGWLAVETLKAQPQLGRNTALLIADGFDHFNPLQAELLARLSGEAKETLITLPKVTGREHTVGRRFTAAQQRLNAEFERLGIETRLLSLESQFSSTRPITIDHLIHYAFRNQSIVMDCDTHIRWIEAPSVKQEARAILRQIKRLLLEGSKPDDVLIAVRDWGQYGRAFIEAATAYQIPIASHYGEALLDSPSMIALLNLLELGDKNFRRRELLDVLRSPYFEIRGFGTRETDLLERISQQYSIQESQDDWLDGIRNAAVETNADEDELEAIALVSKDEAEALHTRLRDFFERITPPENMSVTGYVKWVESLMGHDTTIDPDDGDATMLAEDSLDMLKRVRTGQTSIVVRDLSALKIFKRILKQMQTTQYLFSNVFEGQSNLTSWNIFFNNLKNMLAAEIMERNTGRSGKVLVTTVTDARGLAHPHVFIPGLSEGIFPAPTGDDPLYLDSERVALNARGITLETQAERAGDEGLFFELISQARQTLILSRPTTKDGNYWPESHLWRAARMVFRNADEMIQADSIKQGTVVSADEVSSTEEAILTAAAGLNEQTIRPEIKALYDWLLQVQRTHWERIRYNRHIEHKRITSGKYDRYSGRIEDERLRAYIAEALGERRIWSASQFNDYGVCGFRFFAKRLLKLEAIREPEEGMDAAQLGTLNHAILETTYRRLQEQNVGITPENQDKAVTVLRETADEILRDAPAQIGFRAASTWAHEQVILTRKLEALVRLDFSDKTPLIRFSDQARQVYRLETPFSDVADGSIELELGDGIRVRAQGYIDRIDRIGDGIVVIDYKTGSTTIPVREMEMGRNFQMMLYLLAGQAILNRQASLHDPRTVMGGTFWHLRNQSVSGLIQLNEAGRDAVQAGMKHLSQHIVRGRTGDFATEPNHANGNECIHYCEFKQFCRMSIMKRKKRQTAAPQ
ncbi:MAG: PD-(D/E)XK nuclease family protein [Anaerolineae bacterium]|nr:PD-(D/E)XK nuclease family protein [Anaerolineae bacterium]